jgi:hypothetical protein
VKSGIEHVAIEELGDAAKRLVAAACCAFLRGASPDQERWRPYRLWAGALEDSDTLVTFNYDRVLESLNAFDIFVPSGYQATGRPIVFKMHGSVDWQRTTEPDGSPIYGIGPRKEFALDCPGPEIGIATPGPSKAISTKELAPVWDAALTKLKEAEVIVFVGYRFPPSDAEARERLLGAIRDNEKTRLDVHTVLGPRQHADDVVRLAQMLKAILRQAGRHEEPHKDVERSYWVQPHALYAEDFFTVWSRDLLRPYDHRGYQ